MRVLHIIAGTNPADGGPVQWISQFATIMRGFGNTIEVASLDDWHCDWTENRPMTVHALGSKYDTYLHAPQLYRWLLENVFHYDAIVHHGLWSGTAFTTWRAMRAVKRKYVAFAHGMLDPYFREGWKKRSLKQIAWLASDWWLVRDATSVLFTTHEECAVARRSLWPNSYTETVIRYGTGDVPPDESSQKRAFHELMPALSGAPFLFFLGRLHPKKGCDILLEAFSRVANSRPEFHLVIAGPDERNMTGDLIALASRLGIAEKVHLPGMLVGSVKWGAFRSCEAFVLASHQENFGIVVAEALACGRPVIITDKVNIADTIEACGCGLICSDEVPSFGEALRKFFNCSCEERERMSIRARETFLDKFYIGHTVADVIPILEQLKPSPSTL